MRLSTFAGPVALLALAADSSAQITAPPGYSITVYPIGIQVTGMDIAPPGPFGEQLYLSASGSIRVVDPLTSTVTTFATGLATGSSAPSGIEFDEATFGTGLLYVVQNNGTMLVIDAAGIVSPFASGGGLVGCNDLTCADPGSAFGARAIVTNGGFTGGTMSLVDANGVVTPLAGGAPIVTALGVAIPPGGSAYGTSAYVADTAGGKILRVEPNGTVTPFVTGLPGPADIAFARGGLFGELMYVSDLSSDDVYTIDPAGNVTSFATGFLISNNGWNGDILFDSFGDALYVASNTNLVRISDEPDIPFCYGNGAAVPCPCNNTAPLLARSGCINSTGVGGRLDTFGSNSVGVDDLAFTACQLPVGQFCILFAGTGIVNETPIGDGLRCVGGTLIRLGVRQASAAGCATWGPGMSAQIGWSPGDVLRFQVWYRDPLGGPCATNFNVTNASQVTAAL